MDTGTVFVVIGEDPNVAGTQVRVFATKAFAESHACQLAQTMRAGCKYATEVPDPVESSWERCIEALQDLYGAQYCRIDLLELPIEKVKP